MESENTCYYYDAGTNHCRCYGSESLNALLTENARLKEDMRDLEAYDQILRDRLNQDHDLRRLAENENAELRKLVRGLDYCLSRRKFVSCERCPLYDVTDVNIEPKCVRMMRELGIEVDDERTREDA